MALAERWIERLQKLDSCAISDALDRLGLRGAASGLERRSTSSHIAGRVRTVKLGPWTAEAGHTHLGACAIELAAPGDILAVEQRTGIEAGSWGGILTVAAQLRGVAGVIADGLVRDIDEACQRRFPVFARGVTVRTARGRISEVSTGAPIVIGGVEVSEGDYATADGSGVVFIGAREIERVVTAAEEIVAQEASIVQQLLDGRPVPDALGTGYERMLND